MNLKHSLVCLLLLSGLTFAQHPAPHKKTARAAPVTRPKADPVTAIHQSALIIDTHADTPQRFLDENFDLDQNTPVTEGHIDLRLGAGRPQASGHERGRQQRPERHRSSVGIIPRTALDI